MKKGIIIVFFIGLIFLSANIFSYSTGALNVTNAPGEGNCTGCHIGNLNPDAIGNVAISIDGTPLSYVPGQIYTLHVTTSYNGRTRFGFALAARKSGVQFSNVGTFSSSGGAVLVSDYVTHSSSGTSGTNSKTWTFNWKAPSTDQGPVIFYASGIAANADNSNSGDKVYASTLTFNSPSQTGIDELSENRNISIYPNPAIDFVNVKYKSEKDQPVRISLYSINGSLEEILFDGNSSNGINDHHLNFNQSLKSGIYLIQIASPDGISMNKLFISATK